MAGDLEDFGDLHEEDDPELVTGQLSGNDEIVISTDGEPPLKFKRQP